MFSRLGVPEIVRSDPGTQFSTKFVNFAKEFDFKPIQNSPKYSESNGAVEAAVKIAKSIIQKCEDVEKGLLSYRSTPLENGYSPAELLFSRKIRSLVPMLPSKLGTFIEHKTVFQKETEKKKYQENNYNKRHRAKHLSRLDSGDGVWVKDLQVYAEVIREANTPNSYILNTERGTIIQRNRWHLVYAPHYKRNSNPNMTDSNVPIIDDNIQINVRNENDNDFDNQVTNEENQTYVEGNLDSERPHRHRVPNPRIFNDDFVHTG